MRFLTCGSVDDGKSTLIGRLLYESHAVFEDTLATLARDTRGVGSVEGSLDFALLLDGLQAEREQGITIDVAYRYFSTPRRHFIVADTPGHEQYTRNMATGASNSDLAVLLVDARKGILTQTRRHSYIVHMLGIRHVVLALNKMDLVDFDEARFRALAAEYERFAAGLGPTRVQAIPLSALQGDNLTRRSSRMPWYSGPSLLECLETTEIAPPAADRPLRLPVQWVCRPHADFRGYAGTIAAGGLAAGDTIAVLPSGRSTSVARILAAGSDVPAARAGDAVMLTLADELDIGRGDVFVDGNNRPEISDQFAAHIVWFGTEPMLPGRPYLLRCGAQTAVAQIMNLKHRINIDNLDELAGRSLVMNEIGYCDVSVARPIVFEPYDISRDGGGFILIDRSSNATVAAGMIRFALRRSHNLHWQALEITKERRGALLGQRPCCLWLTGLSGSGKSTIANLLEKRLHALGHHTYILDGDNVRHGLNRDLGFTAGDRVENIRRVGEVAKLMVDAGLITIVSFISPFRAERRLARELFAAAEFVEVFIDTPLAVCEQRDAKGLYRKARRGEITNFTGISAPYEIPENPDLRLDGTASPADLVSQLVSYLGRHGLLMAQTT